MAADEVSRLVLRAQHCRNLAASTEDKRIAQTLREIAAEYQQQAEALMERHKPVERDPKD